MYLHRSIVNTYSDAFLHCFCLFPSLLQHKYVSIAEVQIKREEELQQCPLTLVSNVISNSYNLSNYSCIAAFFF